MRQLPRALQFTNYLVDFDVNFFVTNIKFSRRMRQSLSIFIVLGCFLVNFYHANRNLSTNNVGLGLILLFMCLLSLYGPTLQIYFLNVIPHLISPLVLYFFLSFLVLSFGSLWYTLGLPFFSELSGRKFGRHVTSVIHFNTKFIELYQYENIIMNFAFSKQHSH